MSLAKSVLTGLLLAVVAGVSGAQVIERPVPFDSAGRVMVVTPEIANSLGVTSWPVDRNFTEARLYAVTDSTYVLVVNRRNGTVERYPISAEAKRAFAMNLGAVSAASGKRIGSEARIAFIRNQTLIGLLIYGPTAASVVEGNASSATATYLLVSGATFFAASQLARNMPISSAQNELATHGATRGALAGAAAMHLAADNSKPTAFGALAGGVTGTALGLKFGKTMLEGEAAATGFGADFLALTAVGVVLAAGETCRAEISAPYGVPYGYEVCKSRLSEDGATAMALAGGLVGYPLGYMYARKASYNVTAGDIGTLWATGGLGALAGAALTARDNSSVSALGVAVTTGFVGGVIAGDRLFVRRYDHTRGDAALIGLGTAAGVLMGGGVAVLIDDQSDNPQLAFSLGTVGGVLGLIAGKRFAEAAPEAGKRVTFVPQSLLMAAAKVPGKHPLVQVTF